MRQQETNLKRLNPEDLADHLDRTNFRNVKRIISILDETYAAEVINNLNPNFQTALFTSFTPEKSAQALSYLDPDECVDILLTLTPHIRAKILAILDVSKRQDIESLMQIAHTPLGDIMSLAYYDVTAEMTVGQVKAELRDRQDIEVKTMSVFVLNKTGQLIGFFSLRDLMCQRDETPVFKFMFQNIIVIHLSTPREIAYKKMIKYQLGSLPVIDSERKLVGVVRWFDVAPQI
jgi:magnesium transporter